MVESGHWPFRMDGCLVDQVIGVLFSGISHRGKWCVSLLGMRDM